MHEIIVFLCARLELKTSVHLGVPKENTWAADKVRKKNSYYCEGNSDLNGNTSIYDNFLFLLICPLTIS